MRSPSLTTPRTALRTTPRTTVELDPARARGTDWRLSIHRFDTDGTQLPAATAQRVSIPRLDPRWTNGDWLVHDDHAATTQWTCFVVGASACYHQRR